MEASTSPPENLMIFLIVVTPQPYPPLIVVGAAHAMGKIQKSTSNGGDRQRNGDATATAMDGARAMRWQRNGDNDATATMGGSSLAGAWRRRWWLQDRTTTVTAEA